MSIKYPNLSAASSSYYVEPVLRLGIRKSTLNKFKFLILLISLIFVGLMVPKLSVIMLFCLAILLVRPNTIFLKENLFLFMFSITYFTIAIIFDYPEGPVRAIINVMMVQSAYLLGVNTNWRELPYWPNNGVYAIIAFSMGMFLYSVYCFHFTMENWPLIIYSRGLIHVWFDAELHPLQFCVFTATLIALILPCIVALSRYHLREIFHFKSIIRVMLLLGLISLGLAGLILNTILQNRTAYVILALCSLAIFIYLLWKQKMTANLKMIGILISLITVTYIVLMVFLDIDLLKRIFEHRFEHGVETPRYELWTNGFYNIFEYPLGGGKLDVTRQGMTKWFHNLWLDIVRVSGVLPLILLIIFQMLHLKSIWSILKRNDYEFLKLFIISILIYGLVIYLSIPVNETSTMAFGFTIFCLGVIRNLGYNLALDGRISS